MSHFVLILLSKKNISLYYNADATSSYLQRYNVVNSYGSDEWTPFAAVRTESGLQVGTEFAFSESLKQSDNAYYDIFTKSHAASGNASELPYNAVETFLRQFFLDVYRGEDIVSVKSNLPLALVFCSDVEYEDRIRLTNSFKDNGYGNVANIDFDSCVLNCLSRDKRLSMPYTCTVTNDGQDVILGLYISQTAEKLSSTVISGLGRDTRVNYGVKLLWESLSAHGLSLDNERPILSDIVKRFLEDDQKAMLNETIVLSNNKGYDAYLKKIDIESATLANDQLTQGINIFLKKSEVESAKTGLVFREFSSKSHLLEISVEQSFSSSIKVSDKLFADTLSQLWVEAKAEQLDVSGIGKYSTSNPEGVKAWVKNADNIKRLLDSAEETLSKAKSLVKPVADDLKQKEAIWLEHMKQADYIGAKLNLKLDVGADFSPISADLDVRKNELDDIFSIIHAVTLVDDAKSSVERYNNAVKNITLVKDSIEQISQFVSVKMAETDKYESLFPEYKKTLDELRKTSVKSQQDKLIEKIKTLVPAGFELPTIQTNRIKVKMSAEVTSSGFLFMKKKKLHVTVDFGSSKVPFRCVLAMFTNTVSRVDRATAYVEDLNDKGENLEGVIERVYDLPLPVSANCGKKGELTIKLWPSDEESIGINTAFEGNTCKIDQD